jgi:hypothetical protein
MYISWWILHSTVDYRLRLRTYLKESVVVAISRTRGRLASGSENSVVSRLHPSVHHTIIFYLLFLLYYSSILSTVLFYAINWASEQVKEVLSVRKKSVTLDIFERDLHGSIRDIVNSHFFLDLSGLRWVRKIVGIRVTIL